MLAPYRIPVRSNASAARRRSRLLAAAAFSAALLPFALATQDAAAQAPPSQGAQSSAPAAPRDFSKLLLKQGTPVPLKLAQAVDAKYAMVGEPVELVLADDLVVYDAVVVRKGARVLGTVTAGKEKEKRGEATALALRVDFLKSGANTIKLSGDSSASGKRDKDAMVAGTIFFGLSGLLATSKKHYVLPAGTPATAYVAEDVELPRPSLTRACSVTPLRIAPRSSLPGTRAVRSLPPTLRVPAGSNTNCPRRSSSACRPTCAP